MTPINKPAQPQKPKPLLSPFLLKKTNKHIIPIASGKGGVGKTFFSLNLGIHLAKLGKKPVVIDLDLGCSNLHTYMGLKNTQSGVAGFLNSKYPLAKYKIQTKYGGLEIIPGDQLIPDAANITNLQKRKIMEGIYTLPNDYIILDLGAGASPSVADFFLMSSKGIVVTHPTHGAVLNAFSFLKTVVYRLFRLNFRNIKIRRIISQIKRKDDDGKFPTFWDILNEIGRIDKRLAVRFKKILDSFKPAVVFNMIETVDDVSLIRQLITLIYNKLILDLDLLGYIPKQNEVHYSVKKRKPLSFIYPNCKAAQNITKMATKLSNLHELKQPLFNLEKYDNSVDEIEDVINADGSITNPKPVPSQPRTAAPVRKVAQAPAGMPQGGKGQMSKNPFDIIREKADEIARQQGQMYRPDGQ